MSFPLTVQQAKVKAAIVALTRELGQSPSIVELAERVGLARTPTHHMLKLMRERGHVTWLPGRERTLRVIDHEQMPDLPPELQQQLDLYCVTNQENPRDVFIDALTLHFDSLSTAQVTE